MNDHLHSQGTSTLVPAQRPASPTESQPASFSSRMLQKVCLGSGAKRACLLSIRNATYVFEDGYEMSEQVFHNVASQLFWNGERHQIHEVLLGLKEKLCLRIELRAQRECTRHMLALFDATTQITPYMIGKMEGIAQAWLEAGSSQLGHIPRLIDACSVCDRIETKQGWMRWASFLDARLKLSVSHKICEECAHDLYDEALQDNSSWCTTTVI